MHSDLKKSFLNQNSVVFLPQVEKVEYNYKNLGFQNIHSVMKQIIRRNRTSQVYLAVKKENIAWLKEEFT